MVVIDPRILSKAVKAITPKEEKQEEAQIRGTIVFRNNEQFVKLDGASDDSLTPISDVAEGASDAGFVHGDRVLVLIKNHQAIVTKNLTTGLQAQAAKEASAFITAITDEGITAQRIIANDTFTNTLRANHIKADDIIAGLATIDTLDATYATIDSLDASNARISNLEADHVSVSDFQAEQANIDTLQANTADIDTIRANSAKVQNLTAAELEADHATIGTLDTTYATIENLNATNANVQSLQTNKADISDLNAATARIGSLEADHVTTAQINAVNGEITNLKSSKADISVLEANYATLDELHSDYAEIDLANVNNAWIENGVVKDAAISDAQIIGVSANKLTAGTIDASNITVTNLNADNITTGTINGQRIGSESITLDKLAEEVPTKAYLDNVANNLQGQIDGQIETWTGTVIPTLNNTPASAWTTADDRHKHVGDIYYVVNAGNTADGYTYRFTESGTTTKTYSWTLIKDNQITKALQDILDMQDDISDIQTFDSQISSWKTDTDDELSSLKTRTSTLETNMGKKVDTTTFNEVSQKVDENSANITSLSSVVDTKADGSTVTTLSNTVNSVSQKADSNSSKITNLTTTFGTNADGTSKDGDIVHRTSDVEQDISRFKTTVSETYQTKSDMSNYSTTTQMNSAIEQKAGEISLSVAQTEISKIEIGGKNLLRGTSTLTITSSGSDWQHGQFYKSNSGGTLENITLPDTPIPSVSKGIKATITTANTIIGFAQSAVPIRKQELTQSVWVKGNSGDIVRIQPIYKYVSGGSDNENGYKEFTIEDSDWHKYTFTKTPKYEHLSGIAGGYVYVKSATVGNVLYICADKMEYGNKATDWTPAPEDVEAYTDTQVSAAKAEIKVTTDGISTEVSKKVGSSEIISKINQSAETVKIEANKVEIDGIATFNAIKASADAAYDSKGSASAVQTNLDNLEVGGRNYCAEVAVFVNGSASEITYTYKGDGVWNISGTATAANARGTYAIIDHFPALGYGDTFTLSLDDTYDSMPSGMYFYVNFADSSSTTSQKVIYGDRGASSITFTCESNYRIRYIGLGFLKNAAVNVNLRMKLERGNKATDWSPAPEDVQAEINAKKSVHTLDTSYSYTYANILTYSAEGYSGTWTSNGALANGVKIGDTVRLKVTVSDMSDAPVYVVGTVTAVTTNAVTMTSHGLDTTVIDGGNILTNSIGANQIAANAITSDKLAANAVTIGKIASNTQSQILNSEIEVGGRNYAKTNEEYNNPLTEVGITATVIGPSTILLNGTATEARMLFNKRSTAFGGLTLKAGTYNIWFTNTSGSNLYFRVGKGTGATHVYSTPGEYTKDSPLTITVSSEDIYYVAVTVANGATFTDFQTSIMFEKGSKTTDWSPAPEDVQDEISGDGRNLLRTAASRERPTEYHAYSIPTTVPFTDFKLGEKITVQLWDVVADSNSTGVRVFWGGGNIPLHTSRKPDANGYLSFTYTVTQAHLDDSTASNAFIRIYNVLSGHSGMNLTVGKWKLERGTRATDWTPSPEDVDADIADSAKTATTYITAIDNDGIRVHAANNPTSNYAKINADGMEVYKGGTRVAQFGESVRLGTTDRLELSENRIALRTSSLEPFVVKKQTTGTSTTQTMVVEIPWLKIYTLPPTLTSIQVCAGTTTNPTGSLDTIPIPSAGGASQITNNEVLFSLLDWNTIANEPSFHLWMDTGSHTVTRYAKIVITYTEYPVQVTINHGLLNVQTSTIAIAQGSTGKLLDDSKIITYGQIAVVNLKLQTTASVASGSNIFNGNIYSMLPIGGCRLSGYYGGTPVLGGINEDGSIIVRNCGSSALSVTGNNFISVGGTYIFDGISW